MKKVISILLMLTVLMALVGCAPKGYFDIEEEVKRDYLYRFVSDEDATIDDVKFSHFYGMYDECLVANINYKGHAGMQIYYERKIEGMVFEIPSPSYDIQVWKKNKFYDLEEAYEDGTLTLEDIKTIHSLHLVFKEKNYEYYGSYNGAEVNYHQSGGQSRTAKIAKAEFDFIDGGEIIVQKNGNTYNLEKDIDELLDSGILTKKNVQTIKSLHDRRNQVRELV